MSNPLKDRNTHTSPIPITRPFIDKSEEAAVADVLRSGWVAQGPQVAEFEQLVAKFANAKYAIAVSSGTTALHLSLLLHGIGSGDEVLVPSFTFIATANAVEYTGAKPVFIDINPSTFIIDPEKIREYLQNNSSKARCIIPVSLFGLCVDMPVINSIANEFKLSIIEDAACGLGAFRDNYHAGTEAEIGCFSFHPRKIITTGEGGMIITNNRSIAEKLRLLRNHGASKIDLERHSNECDSLMPEYNVLGYNYRMTDLQGTLGVTQMNKIKNIIQQRHTAAKHYDELLNGIEWIKTPYIPDNYRHAFQSYVCRYKTGNINPAGSENINWKNIDKYGRERNRILAGLEEEEISARQGTHAIHTLGYYKKKYLCRDYDYPVSFIADRLSIALPLYPGITENEQQRVVDTLFRLVKSI